MKDIYLPFIRQEGIDITTIAIMKLKVTDETKKSDVVDKLIDVITQWINNTEDGKKAWGESCDDFNVGDLSSYEDLIRETMSKELMTVGIHYFEIIFQEDSEKVEDFDTVLVNLSSLNPE